MTATASSRPRRADAQRNRDAILHAALEIFAREGALASLDGIAARAGVGNATLYRNFPTRDDLLAAVMQESIAAQLIAGDEIAETLAPADALREWMQQLAWAIRVWHDLPGCVVTALADEASPMQSACIPLQERTGVLLATAKRAGAVAGDVTADEIFELVTTLSWGIDRFGDDSERARRRVAQATEGLFV